jgi:hypothetical protein
MPGEMQVCPLSQNPQARDYGFLKVLFAWDVAFPKSRTAQ